MKNTKLITILTFLCTSLLKADCGGGNTFLAATGGSFFGSCLSNAIMRPRQSEVIVQQAPPQYVPTPVPVNDDPEMDYERVNRNRARRRAQDLEEERIKLELIKEENKAEELRLRRLELERRQYPSGIKKVK